jgi:hypothetical protein
LLLGDDVEIKDVLPSLVTGVVTFAALLFTYLNNQEQREVQLKTTIGKEWKQDVTLNITAFVTSSFKIKDLKSIVDSPTYTKTNVDNLKMELDKMNEIVTALLILLDKNKILQKNLSEIVVQLYYNLANRESNDSEYIAISIANIREATHKLFTAEMN